MTEFKGKIECECGRELETELRFEKGAIQYRVLKDESGTVRCKNRMREQKGKKGANSTIQYKGHQCKNTFPYSELGQGNNLKTYCDDCLKLRRRLQGRKVKAKSREKMNEYKLEMMGYCEGITENIIAYVVSEMIKGRNPMDMKHEICNDWMKVTKTRLYVANRGVGGKAMGNKVLKSGEGKRTKLGK